MLSIVAALNLNRWFVLAVHKATDARHSDAAQEWYWQAVEPEGAWSTMSSYLFIGGLTAEGLGIGVLILAGILSGGHTPLYFVYLLPILPVICAASGEVECRIGQMRAGRVTARTGLPLYEGPQFEVHIVKNNHVLLRSSLIGLFIAFVVAFPLAALDPLR